MSAVTKTLTPRAIETLAEYAHHGSLKEAAACMGIGLQAVKNHLTEVHYHMGVRSSIEALSAMGWTRLPDTERHKAA